MLSESTEPGISTTGVGKIQYGLDPARQVIGSSPQLPPAAFCMGSCSACSCQAACARLLLAQAPARLQLLVRLFPVLHLLPPAAAPASNLASAAPSEHFQPGSSYPSSQGSGFSSWMPFTGRKAPGI